MVINLWGTKMENNKNTKHELFHEYYARWINIYKEGAIRRVTMQKYKNDATVAS